MGIKNLVQENAMKVQLKSCFKGSLLSLIGAVLCLIPSAAHAADLSITKTGPATTVMGSVATFTLSGATNGPLALPNGVVTTVTDTIPPQFTSIVVISAPTWGCTVVGHLVKCTRNLAIGGNSTYPLITVDAVSNTPGNYQNCADISFVPIVTTQPDQNLSNNHNCVNGVITATVAHDVSIAKTVVPGPFTVGGYVQFTLHPGNSGPGSLSVGSGDVSITDMIPAGFSFAGWSSPSGWTCPSPAVGTAGPVAIVCNYSGSPVAAGNPMSTINIAIKANVAGTFQNCANITYNHPPGDNWPANNHSCVPFVVGTPPVAHDVDITKTVSGTGPFPVGSSVQFTLHPGNAGPGTLTVGSGDVTVTDIVPAGFTFQGWSGNGWNCPSPAVNTVSPFTITCNYIGVTVVGGNILNPINIALKANTAGSYQNCANIAYNHPPGDAWPGNNNSCVPFVVGTPPVAHDVDITKTVGSGPFTVGGNVVFTLHPHNAGPTTLSVGPNDVTVTDTVPAGFTYVSATGTGWLCPTPSPTVGPFTITCTYPTGPVVNAGNPMNAITVTLKATATGTMQNCTDIAYNHAPGDAWMFNNHACVNATVTSGPDVSATKNCVVNGPQSVYCTITVTNNGTTPTTSPMHIADVVSGAPSNATLTGGGGTLGTSCTPGAGPITPISCNANTSLLPGSANSKTATFSFHLPTGGTMTNCATVTTPQTDPNPGNNTNICSTVTVPPPAGGNVNFKITKQFMGTVVPGTYTIHISCNNGYTGPSSVALVVPPNPSNGATISVPVGATCTFTENPISGWQVPLFGGSSQPINPNLTWGATVGPFHSTMSGGDQMQVTNHQ
jgi:uncharacterized repeat protein (TIGR01451 family)